MRKKRQGDTREILSQNRNKRPSSSQAALIVTASILLVFFVKLINLSAYFLQISALFIAFYLIAKKLTFNRSVLDIFLFTSITFLLVAASGGLSSPFFFLIYFLLFAIALMADPLASLVASVVTIGFFLATEFILPSQSAIPAPADFLRLFSLPLITPLAYYFGREHIKLYQQQKKLISLQNQVKNLTQELSFDKKLNYKDKKNLALKEQILLWLTTIFHGHLTDIEDAIQNLDFSVKQKLDQPKEWKKLKHQVWRLKKLAGKLKELLADESYN